MCCLQQVRNMAFMACIIIMIWLLKRDDYLRTGSALLLASYKIPNAPPRPAVWLILVSVNMISYVFVIFIVAGPQVFADEEGDIMSCLELFKPENVEKQCCDSLDVFKEEMESCITKDGEWEVGRDFFIQLKQCSNSKCMLEKAGLLNGETIDEKKVEEAIEKAKQERPDDKAMFERVRSQCLKGKFEDYPPKQACPLIKFQICSYINSAVECPAWKKDDTCKKLSESAKICKSALDSMKEK